MHCYVQLCAPRLLVVRQAWRQDSEGTYTILYHSQEEDQPLEEYSYSTWWHLWPSSVACRVCILCHDFSLMKFSARGVRVILQHLLAVQELACDLSLLRSDRGREACAKDAMRYACQVMPLCRCLVHCMSSCISG